MRPLWWWAESASPGEDRVKVSGNLGATSVAPVAPVDTSLPKYCCIDHFCTNKIFFFIDTPYKIYLHESNFLSFYFPKMVGLHNQARPIYLIFHLQKSLDKFDFFVFNLRLCTYYVHFLHHTAGPPERIRTWGLVLTMFEGLKGENSEVNSY